MFFVANHENTIVYRDRCSNNILRTVADREILVAEEEKHHRFLLEGGGAVLSSTVRVASADDLCINPTIVIKEIGKKKNKQHPKRMKCKNRFVIGEILLLLHLLTIFFCPGEGVHDNECLTKALRSIGAKVPLGSSQGYWAQKDGNKMLEKIGKRLEAVECPTAEDVGRYVVHSQNHFMGLRIHVDKADLFDGTDTYSVDRVSDLHTRLRDPRFYKLCPNDWEHQDDYPTHCKRCGETILGTQMIQDECGPLHFGCLDLAYPYDRYYPDDAFGCAIGNHECFQDCPEDKKDDRLEECIAKSELDLEDGIPRKCVFQDSSYYFVRIRTNANGACGLHALLGKPVNNELYLEKARQYAVKLMRI